MSALSTGCAAIEASQAAAAPAPQATALPTRDGAPRAPDTPPEARLAALPDADWGYLVAPQLSLEIPLPDRGGWQATEDDPRWVTVRHTPSGSVLAFRIWRAQRSVRLDDCERQLALWRPELREADSGGLIDQRRLSAPEGFHARLRMWVESGGTGVALATGAKTGRCYAGIFRTRATEVELARRLRLVGRGTFERVRFLGVEGMRRPDRPELPF